ncbi:MAG: glycosyltransferase [Anaerolineae bacterium]|nr:glycosyltransferase [Anaerolineae bacterium]
MNRPIVLLHVIPTLGLGGAERFLVDLCRALPAHRYRVIVATVSGEGPRADDLRQAGIEVFPLRVRSHWQLNAVLRLARFMRQQRVDIVHTHLFVGEFFGRLAAKLAGVPVVISTAQNAYAPGYLLPRAQVLAGRLLARLDDRLVAVSQGARDYLIQVEGVAPARIEIVPNAIAWPEPVSPAQVEAARRDLGAEGRSPLLGTVARLTPQKGLAYLLQALVTLRTRFPNLFCVIIGEGELRAELEALAVRLELQHHVRFCGLRRDVPALLQCLDLFVLPSLFEGLPLALLEAMAAGRPVVATDVAGSSEVIEDGVSGRLVPPGDATALAQAMAELLDDRERAQALARQGQETVRRRYTIGPVAEAYERIYEELLQAKGRCSGHTSN